METTATFDAIVTLAKRRNDLLDRRDKVRESLRQAVTPQLRAELEIQYWSVVGVIDGLGQALEALREAGEHVGSAEYLAIWPDKTKEEADCVLWLDEQELRHNVQ